MHTASTGVRTWLLLHLLLMMLLMLLMLPLLQQLLLLLLTAVKRGWRAPGVSMRAVTIVATTGTMGVGDAVAMLRGSALRDDLGEDTY